MDKCNTSPTKSERRLSFEDRLNASPLTEGEAAEREAKLQQRQRDAELQKRRATWERFIARRPRRKDARLDTYHVANDHQRELLRRLRWYSDTITERIRAGDGILLFGTCGTGKDHLLVALARQAISQGHVVTWRNGMDFYADLRDRMESDQTERSFLSELIGCEVLYVSDPLPPIGALTQYQMATLFRVLDARYELCRPTWVSLNATNRQDLDQRMGATLADRIVDQSLTYFCNWPSHRQKLSFQTT